MNGCGFWQPGAKTLASRAGEINASTAVVEDADVNLGAIIMGRNMFGGGTGPRGEDPWKGW
jgi:hypothetical protein